MPIKLQRPLLQTRRVRTCEASVFATRSAPKESQLCFRDCVNQTGPHASMFPIKPAVAPRPFFFFLSLTRPLHPHIPSPEQSCLFSRSPAALAESAGVSAYYKSPLRLCHRKGD